MATWIIPHFGKILLHSILLGFIAGPFFAVIVLMNSVKSGNVFLCYHLYTRVLQSIRMASKHLCYFGKCHFQYFFIFFIRSTFRAAEWLFGHLAGQVPIVMVTQDEQVSNNNNNEIFIKYKL